ncbi:MAG: MinD/ParA family protein [Halorientalis sp.]
MTLAVTGGKGGVGKTTVAYNLGAALDAVVVDADLGMADLPGSRGPDLHDVLAGRARPCEAVREGGAVPVLPCGRSLVGARASDPTALAAAIDAVADEYGRVVVDCPAGLDSDVGLSLCVADACVLVTTPDRTAVADAVRARALARELDAGLCRVALNRAGRDPPAEALARELGAPVTAVPESPAMARAQRAGRPVADIAPDSDAAARLRELAAAVQESLSAW